MFRIRTRFLYVLATSILTSSVIVPQARADDAS
jgi:hypothetical protein